MTELNVGDRVKIRPNSAGVAEDYWNRLGTVGVADWPIADHTPILLDDDECGYMQFPPGSFDKLVPDIEAYHIGDNVDVVMKHIRGTVAINGQVDLTLTLDNGEYFSIAKSDIHSLKVTEAGAKPPVWANGHSIRLSLTKAVYTRDSLTNADVPWYQVGGQVSHSITDAKVDELFRKGSVKIIGKPA